MKTIDKYTDYKLDHKTYMKEAFWNASLSNDRSTWVGSIIVNPYRKEVISAGHNGVGDYLLHNEERFTKRPDKYYYLEHAERRSIFSAAFHGKSTANCVMYATWYACADCAKAIVEAGIQTVIGHQKLFDIGYDRWAEQVDVGLTILREAGVGMFNLTEPLGESILFNGNMIDV